MKYRIEVIPKAVKQIEKLDKETKNRILNFLGKKLPALENRRGTGRALEGRLSGLWRYRTGDCRILCRIEDERILILVLSVRHRRDIYKTR